MAKAFRCDETTVVKTKAGALQGYFYDGSFIFKGIHYAEADRFKQPVPVEPWEGVKDATSYGFVCPLMHQDTPNGELMVPHAYWPQNEHCQSLNVWTTSLDSKAKKPVMVWLHGGGYAAGSSIEQLAYDGANMAKYGDVVVVTVNHRLNILGYLDLSEFGKEYKNSGNCGHADMVAALRWVNKNIASFGGDPKNVTIFGQSGGGEKVKDLTQIPAADGLFQKGIIMSGIVDTGIMYKAQGSARPLIEGMLKELGLEEKDVSLLETLPYTDLVEAYDKVAPAMMAQGLYAGGYPRKNDFFLGEPHIEGGAFTEHAKTIPILIGSVLGEFDFAPAPYDRRTIGDKETDAVLKARYGAAGKKIGKLFMKAYPDKRRVDAASVDTFFRVPSKQYIKARCACPESPVFVYQFCFEFPIRGSKIAWHCSDIPFFFHNVCLVPSANVPGVSDKLEEQMFAAFMSFARTGNPGHSELPDWPAVVPGDEAVMIFDRTCRLVHNHDDELLALIKANAPAFVFPPAGDEESQIQH